MKVLLKVACESQLSVAIEEAVDGELGGRNDEIEQPEFDAADEAVRKLLDAWLDDENNLLVEMDTDAGTLRVVREVVTDAGIAPAV